jgi:hypothetical protein
MNRTVIDFQSHEWPRRGRRADYKRVQTVGDEPMRENEDMAEEERNKAAGQSTAALQGRGPRRVKRVLTVDFVPMAVARRRPVCRFARF